jgi:hypothetical protein
MLRSQKVTWIVWNQFTEAIQLLYREFMTKATILKGRIGRSIVRKPRQRFYQNIHWLYFLVFHKNSGLNFSKLTPEAEYTPDVNLIKSPQPVLRLKSGIIRILKSHVCISHLSLLKLFTHKTM